jgi:hypothetical protein
MRLASGAAQSNQAKRSSLPYESLLLICNMFLRNHLEPPSMI